MPNPVDHLPQEGQNKSTQGQPAQQACFFHAAAVLDCTLDRKIQVAHQLAKSIFWVAGLSIGCERIPPNGFIIPEVSWDLCLLKGDIG